MSSANKSILRKLLSKESEWSPKVMVGRAVVAVLPDGALHRFKKAYYAYLLKRAPKEWIENDSLIVQKLISPGDTVIDIGANIGFYTRFLSGQVGPAGRVYSFEPIPQTFEILANNVRKIAITNAELLNYALSDTDRSETMVIPTYRWGSECWYDARVKTERADPSWRTIKVKTIRLDNLFAGAARKIAFIKCDANYHELAVLRGALATIRASRPAMLIEVSPDPDNPSTTAFETFNLLRGEGYRPYCFDGSTLDARRAGQRSQNYFFLTPEHIQTLRQQSITVAEA